MINISNIDYLKSSILNPIIHMYNLFFLYILFLHNQGSLYESDLQNEDDIRHIHASNLMIIKAKHWWISIKYNLFSCTSSTCLMNNLYYYRF